LGSILSWDEEDEDANSAAAEQEVKVSSVEKQNLSNSIQGQSHTYNSYPQKISIIAMQPNNPSIQTQMSHQPYQIMVQNVQGFPSQQPTVYQQQIQQQQIQMTNYQGQNQQQQLPQQGQQVQSYSLSGNLPQQQILQIQQVTNGGQSQQCQLQHQHQQSHPCQIHNQQLQQHQQQAMANGSQIIVNTNQNPQFATIYQQPVYTNQSHDQISVQSLQMIPGQQSQSQDQNVYLRTMQNPYQRVQESGGQAIQQGVTAQQTPVPMMPPIPTQTHISHPTKKSGTKRKASDIKPPSAPKSNIVSCSDTDGETKIGASSNSKTHKSPAEVYEPSNEDLDADAAHLTPAEKAKANRDRNREHARNTRLRKKAYLEQLKMTVDELCQERDTLVSERAGASSILLEMHNTRTEVLMSFFALRSGYEKKRELWASILDESCFVCVMPVTPYRSFPASEVQVSKCQRTVLGIDAMMADTASLHVLLNNLVDRSRYSTSLTQFRYTLVTEDAVVAGNQMMARWVMSTINASSLGARMEVTKQGMLCCKFNSAHKIIGLELMFDVMAFMLQLKQAAGSHEFSVVPNTVQTCQRVFKQPMVMTLAEPPYTIVQVNKLWEDMTGYKAENVVGKSSCRILQGHQTCRNSVENLMSEIRFKRSASAILINYTNEGKLFRNCINVYPLSTDSKITHYVALTGHFEKVESTAEQAEISSGGQILTLPTAAPPPRSNQPHQSAVKPPAQLMHVQPIHSRIQGQPIIPPVGVAMPLTVAHPIVYYPAQPRMQPNPVPLLPSAVVTPTVIAPRGLQTGLTKAKAEDP
jgi:PAS domain S-box-containing protein